MKKIWAFKDKRTKTIVPIVFEVLKDMEPFKSNGLEIVEVEIIEKVRKQ